MAAPLMRSSVGQVLRSASAIRPVRFAYQPSATDYSSSQNTIQSARICRICRICQRNEQGKPVSGCHVLRIDGYSHLKEAIRHGEGIESCDFDVGDHTWRLVWYPNGDRPKFRSHIALYLKLVCDPQDEPVRAQSQFSLLDQHGKPGLQYDLGMCKFSPGGSSSWGFKDFIRKKELEKSMYLKDDRFAIQCNISVTTVRKCSDNWAFISQDHKSDEPPVLG